MNKMGRRRRGVATMMIVSLIAHNWRYQRCATGGAVAMATIYAYLRLSIYYMYAVKRYHIHVGIDNNLNPMFLSFLQPVGLQTIGFDDSVLGENFKYLLSFHKF